MIVPQQSAFAVKKRDTTLNADASYEAVFMPVLTSTSVVIDRDTKRPQEPNLGKAKFLKYPHVASLDERVDRLVYGIETDIKPELDHYGYEIRRYMSSVGNMEVFHNKDRIVSEIKNTKKARVIADYWKKHIDQELVEIQALIDEDTSIDLRVRTAFKQNKIAAQTFLISLKSWIDANERILMHIYKQPDIFEVIYPEILVVVPTSRVEFYNLYATKQAKLKDIQRYHPFALMVY